MYERQDSDVEIVYDELNVVRLVFLVMKWIGKDPFLNEIKKNEFNNVADNNNHYGKSYYGWNMHFNYGFFFTFFLCSFFCCSFFYHWFNCAFNLMLWVLNKYFNQQTLLFWFLFFSVRPFNTILKYQFSTELLAWWVKAFNFPVENNFHNEKIKLKHVWNCFLNHQLLSDYDES